MRPVVAMSLICTSEAGTAVYPVSHTINGNLICVPYLFLQMHMNTFEQVYTFLYISVTFIPHKNSCPPTSVSFHYRYIWKCESLNHTDCPLCDQGGISLVVGSHQHSFLISMQLHILCSTNNGDMKHSEPLALAENTGY